MIAPGIGFAFVVPSTGFENVATGFVTIGGDGSPIANSSAQTTPAPRLCQSFRPASVDGTPIATRISQEDAELHSSGLT